MPVLLCILPLAAFYLVFGTLGLLFYAVDRWGRLPRVHIPRARDGVPAEMEAWLRCQLEEIVPTFRHRFDKELRATPRREWKRGEEEFKQRSVNAAYLWRCRFEEHVGLSAVLFPRDDFRRVVLGAYKVRAPRWRWWV